MSNTFNILIGIDVDAIAEYNQFSSNMQAPKLIDPTLNPIHMLTYNGTSVTDNYASSITVSPVSKDDVILWSGVSLSPVNSPYSALITSFKADDSRIISYNLDSLLSKQGKRPVPYSNESGNSVTMVPFNYWRATVKTAPDLPVSIGYTGKFTLYNEDTIVGFCQWKYTLILKSTN
ncbi:AidA/PixA family protein [Xenorhabdus bovienii]|uniref:AidA/PixA family protein n=1 Tax=Xenorhabdus bovienii TaxID=40576 RepID=UPI0023B3388A|nr:AidA/PixA family protein [Xenorhabdus bovienii]MDE9486040.1 inclusion body family protein [Xenorhabdus bovienii]